MGLCGIIEWDGNNGMDETVRVGPTITRQPEAEGRPDAETMSEVDSDWLDQAEARSPIDPNRGDD